MDESYRKAGKMDTVNFATNLDLHSSGLIESIRNQLLGWGGAERSIKVELYKLNAYSGFSPMLLDTRIFPEI